ncbi:MAG: GNAT family N-acetyltransferase [Bacteroidetes bacterium]|nr:GNAT family N-acetyltransferase [Bacteroidota bacterium]
MMPASPGNGAIRKRYVMTSVDILSCKLRRRAIVVWKNIKVNFPNTSFGVEEVKASSLVGMTFLKNINMIFRHAEFSILIDSAQKGKGYGKEACYKTLEFGFRHLGLNKIYLKVRTDNTSAIRIYEACGFKVEGTLREDIYKQGKFADQFYMGILVSEFEKL